MTTDKSDLTKFKDCQNCSPVISNVKIATANEKEDIIRIMVRYFVVKRSCAI